MFKMFAFSFDARRESFAKAQNRFADCLFHVTRTAVYGSTVVLVSA